MKKLKNILIMALLCAFFICVNPTYASDIFYFGNGKISGFITDYQIPENYTLVIPDKVDDEYVTAIANGAFKGNTNIVALDLSQTTHLQEIQFGAFTNCAISGTLVLPTSITNIVRTAFKGNPIDYVIVNNIYNGEAVISISDTAFETTTKLVFNSLEEQKKFADANTAFDSTQLTHKLEVKVNSESGVVNTGIEIMSGDELGDNLNLLLTNLKSTFGENLIGLKLNNEAVLSSTAINDGDILEPVIKRTAKQNALTITKEYGEDVVVSADAGDTYKWYNNDTLLNDQTTQSLTLSGLNIGTYTYKSETYKNDELIATNTYTIVIEKARISVSFSVGEYTYDGQAHNVTFSISPARFSASDFTLQYVKNNATVSEVISAGTYKAEVAANNSLADKIVFNGDNFVNFTVEKQIIPVTFNVAESYDYLEFTTNGLNPIENKANALYELYNETTDTYETNDKFCVGLWRITLLLKDEYNENYRLLPTSTTFRITPSKLLITWPNDTYVYDDKEVVIECGLNKDVSADIANLQFSTASTTSATRVGSYTAEAVGFGNKNFVLDENAITIFNWSITPKMISVNWSSELLYYNGTMQAPTAFITINNIKIDLEVNGKQTNANETSVTPYTASVTMPDLEDTENYALENPTITFRILRKIENLTVLDDIVTRVYDGEYFVPHYDYRGTRTIFFKTDKESYPQGIKEVGEYFLTVYTEDTDNYVGISGHCMVRIIPAKLESKKDNILVEVEDNGGIPLYSTLSVKEIQLSNDSIQFSEIADGDNLKVQKVVSVDINNENEDISQDDFTLLKFKLKNNPKGLRVFKITTNGLIECAYSIENGYICIEKASMGTYAFLCDKTNWFTSVGIWVIIAVLATALITIILVFTFKKSPRDNRNFEIASQIEKTQHQKYLSELKGETTDEKTNKNSLDKSSDQAKNNITETQQEENIETSDEQNTSDENAPDTEDNSDEFHDAD